MAFAVDQGYRRRRVHHHRAGPVLPYEIQVPQDHPRRGLYWYHPHRHGGVAQQVRGGMAGAIVVRGDLDEVPEVAAAGREGDGAAGDRARGRLGGARPDPNPDKSQAFYPRSQILWTIRRCVSPTHQDVPGRGAALADRERGRGQAGVAQGGRPQSPPARPGTAGRWRHRPRQKDTLLFPGNRVDLLIKAGGHGVYDLVLSPGSSQKPFVPGMPEIVQPPGPNGHAVSGELVPRTIATIEVVGNGDEMDLPTKLPAYEPEMFPVVKTREVGYTVDRSSTGSSSPSASTESRSVRKPSPTPDDARHG